MVNDRDFMDMASFPDLHPMKISSKIKVVQNDIFIFIYLCSK